MNQNAKTVAMSGTKSESAVIPFENCNVSYSREECYSPGCTMSRPDWREGEY
jgi:hypothetical protein